MTGPGGPYGAEHAVVINNDGQTMQMAANLLAMTEQRRRYEQQRAQEDRDRQDQLMMYLGKEFDEKNFATGTPSDRIINDSLGQMKKNYAGMIMKNPSMRIADLGYMIQGDVEKLNRYSVAAKTIRQQIDDITKGLEADKSIDAKAIRNGALHSAFFEHDPNTNTYVPRDPDKIDMSADYVGTWMKEHPELWSRGRTGVDNWLEGMKPVKVGDRLVTDNGGIKNVYEWEADQLPFQTITKDKNGKPVGLGIKTQQVQLADGSNMDVLDEETYQSLVSNLGAKGYLESMIKKHPIFNQVGRDSKEGEILKRRFALEMLSQTPQMQAFRTKKEQDRTNLRDKIDLGMGIAAALGGKQPKPNVIEGLLKARVGDPLLIQGADAKGGMIDISSRLPGATVYSGKIKKKGNEKAYQESYYQVLFNPRDGEFYTKDERASKPKKVENFDKWLQDIAEANGVKLSDVEGLISKFKDGSGNYKWVNGESPEIISLATNNRYQSARAKEIDDFASKYKANDQGASSSLKKVLEEPITIDGVTGDVKGVTFVPAGWFTKPKVKFTFNDEEKELSAADFERVLRENIGQGQ